jgi:23S rRNA pseudouridine1911/1915/1917 synthase
MGHLGGEKIQRTEQVKPEHAGQRVDQVAAELFEGFSRSRLQTWIKNGVLTVNGAKTKPKEKLTGNESLTLEVEIEPELDDQPQSIDLDVVYQDDDLIVINKPTGLVVHPAAGHADGTLLNGLLHLDERLNSLPRAGIVHRLDRDTTGLMVVARSLEAHQSLVAQLQDKSLFRQYEAIAVGVMTGGGKVDAPMGRHPVDRKKQAVVKTGGKNAVTHYRVLDRYRAHTRIQVQLETGRTHQIRRHAAAHSSPILGDRRHGGAAGRLHPRLALHAGELRFPALDGSTHTFRAPLPKGLMRLFDELGAAPGAAAAPEGLGG